MRAAVLETFGTPFSGDRGFDQCIARRAPHQVGHMADATATLPAALVRSRAADIRGHAVFHAPFDVRAEAYRQLGDAVLAGQLEVVVEAVPLSDVALAWERQAAGTGGVKLVIVP